MAVNACFTWPAVQPVSPDVGGGARPVHSASAAPARPRLVGRDSISDK
jgi:hypothetical protein